MRRIARPLSGTERAGGGAGAEPPASAQGAQRLKRLVPIALAAGLLALATAAVQLGPWRYVPGGPTAIDDYRGEGQIWFFSRLGAEIRRGPDAPGIELTAGRNISYAARWIRPAADLAYTRVSLEVALEGVTENRHGAAAMLGVVSFDKRGRRLAHWPKVLFLGTGTEPWQRVSLTVPWADEVATMRLELVHAGEAGRISLRGVEIAMLGDAAWHPWAHRALIVGWALLGVVTVTLALRHGRPILPVWAATAAALAIAIGGVLPEPMFRNLTAPVEQPLIALGRAVVKPAPEATAEQRPKPPAAAAPAEGQEPAATARPAPATPPAESSATAEMAELSREGFQWLQQAVGKKVMHAAGFGGLALLVAFVAPPVGLLHVAGIAGFAAVTEVLQMLTVTRGAHLGDIGVDLLSAALGLALGAVIRLLLGRRPAVQTLP